MIVKSMEWLFCSKNCATTAIFGQKVAACMQGRKKNCVRLPSDPKAESRRKDAKRRKTY